MHLNQSLKAVCQSLVPGIRATLAAALVVGAVLPASAATIDRIKETNQINFGYFPEARPFTSSSTGGTPEGFGIDLCQQLADRAKTALDVPQLKVNWVPVTKADYLTQIQAGSVDLLCTPINQTLERRADVSFSIPVFPGGVRAVMREDAAKSLRDALNETPASRTLWRGSPAVKILGKKSFGVVAGTTSETWLAGKINTFKIDSKAVPVANYEEGIKKLVDGKIDVFFGDRSLVLGAMDVEAGKKLIVLDRFLTFDRYEFALARGDEDFRLLVDRSLSDSYAASGFGDQFFKWFGEYDAKTRFFYDWNVIQPK
ncbi:MAG TPA: amino acid ABC transporter substrate-binding protein [Cellvibrio sp.]|nr:amino acid ABC transporter substrate-binding protein [Cellvibrio sp.]